MEDGIEYQDGDGGGHDGGGVGGAKGQLGQKLFLGEKFVIRVTGKTFDRVTLN